MSQLILTCSVSFASESTRVSPKKWIQPVFFSLILIISSSVIQGLRMVITLRSITGMHWNEFLKEFLITIINSFNVKHLCPVNRSQFSTQSRYAVRSPTSWYRSRLEVYDFGNKKVSQTWLIGQWSDKSLKKIALEYLPSFRQICEFVKCDQLEYR